MVKENDIYSAKNMAIYSADGSYITSLNSNLAKKQKLSVEEIEMLKDTHNVRFLIFRAMERTDDPAILKGFAKTFDELEFTQQRIWGFEENKDFHYWFEVPKCSCPKLDNYDRYGIEECVINQECIIHGNKDAEAGL